MSLGLVSIHCWEPFLQVLSFGYTNPQLINETLGRVPHQISLYQESEFPSFGALNLNRAFLVETLIVSPCSLSLEYPLGDLLTYQDSSHQ